MRKCQFPIYPKPVSIVSAHGRSPLMVVHLTPVVSFVQLVLSIFVGSNLRSCQLAVSEAALVRGEEALGLSLLKRSPQEPVSSAHLHFEDTIKDRLTFISLANTRLHLLNCSGIHIVVEALNIKNCISSHYPDIISCVTHSTTTPPTIVDQGV